MSKAEEMRKLSDKANLKNVDAHYASLLEKMQRAALVGSTSFTYDEDDDIAHIMKEKLIDDGFSVALANFYDKTELTIEW